jgi:Rrf2 family cysteine metabolism transcriptional repressor
MIRLSTKSRYGARIMLELALHYGRGPLLLKDISKREEISEGYLEHIMPVLKAAGLVHSIRGAHGGYMLAKQPSQITFREIVEALEGTLALVDCVSSPELCDRVDSCVTREIWGQMSEKMLEVLESNTLQDIVERQQKIQGTDSLMYSI